MRTLTEFYKLLSKDEMHPSLAEGVFISTVEEIVLVIILKDGRPM